MQLCDNFERVFSLVEPQSRWVFALFQNINSSQHIRVVEKSANWQSHDYSFLECSEIIHIRFFHKINGEYYVNSLDHFNKYLKEDRSLSNKKQVLSTKSMQGCTHMNKLWLLTWRNGSTGTDLAPMMKWSFKQKPILNSSANYLECVEKWTYFFIELMGLKRGWAEKYFFFCRIPVLYSESHRLIGQPS